MIEFLKRLFGIKPKQKSAWAPDAKVSFPHIKPVEEEKPIPFYSPRQLEARRTRIEERRAAEAKARLERTTAYHADTLATDRRDAQRKAGMPREMESPYGEQQRSAQIRRVVKEHEFRTQYSQPGTPQDRTARDLLLMHTMNNSAEFREFQRGDDAACNAIHEAHHNSTVEAATRRDSYCAPVSHARDDSYSRDDSSSRSSSHNQSDNNSSSPDSGSYE